MCEKKPGQFLIMKKTMADSPQGLWFANPGGSNSIPSRTHSSVQRTRSLPVHTTPQTMVMFQQSGKKRPG